MENHFLTTRYYFRGNLFGIIEKILRIKNYHKEHKIKKYFLKRWLKKQNSNDSTSVGIFNSSKHESLVIKSLVYSFPNSTYEQMINEYNIFKVLNKEFSKIALKINVPKVYELIKSKNMIGFIYEFKKGKSLKAYSADYKKNVIKKCLTAFKLVDKNLANSFPKRSSYLTLLSFPLYFFWVVIRDVKKINNYFKWGFVFYANYLPVFKINPQYIFAHRDLHSQNILIDNNSIALIDPEISAFAEEQTDIAILAKSFARELGKGHLLELMNDLLPQKKQKKRFYALAIYYSFQIMAIRSKDDPDYIEAEIFLITYLPYLQLNMKRDKISKSNI